MSARLHAPSPTGSPSRRSAPAMSHRPFKKRDWDAELARLGVPSDSPMRLIQRNGNAVGDEANNDIVAASEEDGAAAGTVAGGDIGTPDAASENAGGGGARRGWSPARPFDLGADRSPFLTDVAPSPKDDDDHQPDELRRWKPGATPLAVGGMLGDVYGRDDDGKNDGDDGSCGLPHVGAACRKPPWRPSGKPFAAVAAKSLLPHPLRNPCSGRLLVRLLHLPCFLRK